MAELDVVLKLDSWATGEDAVAWLYGTGQGPLSLLQTAGIHVDGDGEKER